MNAERSKENNVCSSGLYYFPRDSMTKYHKLSDFFLLLFSRSVVSDSLWPHGLQHARLPCPSLSPGVNDAIQPSHPLLPTSPPPLNLPQHQGLFQWVVSSHQAAKKYWSFSFSISPSNEYSGLISFRIDQFDLFAVQRTERELSGLKQQKCFISQLWRLEGQIKTLEGLCSVLSLLGRILPCLF